LRDGRVLSDLPIEQDTAGRHLATVRAAAANADVAPSAPAPSGGVAC
jgi:hypothetical protein